MSTYAIGDVQGCFYSLQNLLEKIQFTPLSDQLIFVGDLVNRGKHSLAVLEYIMALNENASTVLGNHDLHLLACLMDTRAPNEHDTLEEILSSPRRQDIQAWLQKQALARIFTHQNRKYFVSHAGLLPCWSNDTALLHAQEIEHVLQSKDCKKFLRNMYGNQPAQWSDALRGMDRLRLITNALTRMRFCNAKGELELNTKENANHAPSGYLPWYQHPSLSPDATVIYGHWAAQGLVLQDNLIGLDTGCVWGGKLSAVRLEDRAVFQVEHNAQDITTNKA